MHKFHRRSIFIFLIPLTMVLASCSDDGISREEAAEVIEKYIDLFKEPETTQIYVGQGAVEWAMAFKWVMPSGTAILLPRSPDEERKKYKKLVRAGIIYIRNGGI